MKIMKKYNLAYICLYCKQFHDLKQTVIHKKKVITAQNPIIKPQKIHN